MKLTVTLNKRALDVFIRETPVAVERGRIATAYDIEREWKRLVPVKTGTYRRSIHTVEQARPGVSVVGTNLTKPPYPLFLENGTRRMRARPSATPAAEYGRRRFVDNVKQQLGKIQP